MIKIVEMHIMEQINTIFNFDDIHSTEAIQDYSESLIAKYLISMPYLLRCEIFKNPQYSRLKKYTKTDDELVVQTLCPIATCVVECPVLPKSEILAGNHAAFESAVYFLLSDIQKNTDVFIQEFPIECIKQVDLSNNLSLAHFFSQISWYFPPRKRAHLHELKRSLSMQLTKQ